MRKVKEMEFNNISEYLDWNAVQYHNQTGIKVCGLKENGEGIVAEYIELF